MPQKINTFDKTTPLSGLRDVLGWDENPLDNAVSLVMILCQRVEALQARVEELEQKQVEMVQAIQAINEGCMGERTNEDWLTVNLPPTAAPYNPRPGAEYGVHINE